MGWFSGTGTNGYVIVEGSHRHHWDECSLYKLVRMKIPQGVTSIDDGHYTYVLHSPRNGSKIALTNGLVERVESLRECEGLTLPIKPAPHVIERPRALFTPDRIFVERAIAESRHYMEDILPQVKSRVGELMSTEYEF